MLSVSACPFVHAIADLNALQILCHANLQSLRCPQLQCYCSRLGLLATGTKSPLSPVSSLFGTSVEHPNSLVNSNDYHNHYISYCPNASSAPSTSFITPAMSSHLLPDLSNLGMPSSDPGATSWLKTITRQAAQAAIQQAIALCPRHPAPTPTIISTIYGGGSNYTHRYNVANNTVSKYIVTRLCPTTTVSQHHWVKLARRAPRYVDSESYPYSSWISLPCYLVIKP